MKIKKGVPYLIAIVIFIIASVLYFHPILKGQKLNQSDITQFTGSVQEIVDYRAAKNTEPYWTGTSFSGMPAYQVSVYYPNDFAKKLDDVIRFLPRPADYVFLYFISFFILLMALKVEWKLAILGALSFGFSTYLIIIFGAGHNAKAHAIAYMPLVLAGILWVFQQKYVLGFVVTSLAMALELFTNHPQMTYYLGFSILILVIVEGVYALKNNEIVLFLKKAVLIIAAVLLGIGANAPRLMAMKEYADFSTRGKSELTIHPDGSQKVATSGLDKEYITQYSYAKLETFNLIVPRFMGGGTVETLDKNSQFYQLIEEKAGKKAATDYASQVLTYWGDQPIVEAPAYIGAVVFFLFFLGIFLVKGRLKQWLVSATIFSILLSWGRNFEILTNFFIDFVPLYNKFRAVSSIQVIAELCVPLLGVLALKEFFSSAIKTEEKQEALKKALYTFVGLIVGGFFLAHLFSTFEGLRDQQQYSQLPGLIDAVIADRKAMLFSDSIRSVILGTLSGGLLWFLLKNKLKKVPVIVAITILILFDLISVNKKYVNQDDFKPARKIEKPFIATEADKLILQDTTHYRVGNFSVDPMNDASTSYFHHSIGGYHAAKMMRYQELFEYQISKNNMQVLNMLNTKYFIITDETNEVQVQQNEAVNGAVWFVNSIQKVATANEEIQALSTLNTKNEAVINTSNITDNVALKYAKDSTATIALVNYDVTSLTYQATATEPQFAVFSEIYYKNGWNAYVNGVLKPHYNVNYVLRGMEIPAGKNIIAFKFEPKVIQQGSIISLSSYALLLLLPLGLFFYEKRKGSNEKK